MTIMLATAVTTIKFQIRRDREEEMVHRGVQYTRAIRAYYRKFNRFPAKIEDLENTNQLRFLRKRYKDPITGKDFKLVHFGEVKMAGAVGMIPGANTVGANGAFVNANQSSGFGNNAFGSNSNSLFSTSSNSGFGQSSNSGFGQNANPQASQGQDASGIPNAAGDTSQNASGSSQSNGPNATGAFGSNSGSDKIGTTQFGGAPIVGVASTSKEQTIREFDKKKKYNEWMFIYDPMMDRGGLIKTPYQPQLMMQMMSQGMQNVNGPNGANPNGNNSGFGNNNGFGNSFGNSPGGMQNNQPSPTGFGTPQPPTTSPQQQ
jgi:hypothetical protein